METLTERINAYSVSAGHGRTIPCLNCGGKGYIVSFGYDGTKRPVACRGCNGTGSQTVR